jgi:hypothetical protein
VRKRSEVTFSVLCTLLAACSAVSSAPLSSNDPTVEGVGVLPSADPSAVAPATDGQTVPTTQVSTTTTVAAATTIGTLVTGNKLLMIGDSITASAAKRFGGELCNALVPLGWQVEVDAEPSRFIDFGNTVLDRRLAAGWDAAYVFLGTNYLGNAQVYRKQLEKIVSRLAPRPVVVLNITEFEDSRSIVNDVITIVQAEYPDVVHVIDWAAIAAADASTILRGDGHHLTNEGRGILAATVAQVMGQAAVQPGDCLSTSFTDDSGGSVNGSDKPSKKKVGTAVKPPTVTTTSVKGATTTTVSVAGPTTTTKPVVVSTIATTAPPATTLPPPVTTQAPPVTPTQPPTTPAPTTLAP